MGRVNDVKVVAGVVQMLMIRYDGCQCLGALDACVHCELRIAQEALERLIAPDRLSGEPAARHAEALTSPLARER